MVGIRHHLLSSQFSKGGALSLAALAKVTTVAAVAGHYLGALQAGVNFGELR
jgi:hypothetical protein